MKISHFLGFHDPIDSKETGEVKFSFQSPFDLFITRYTQYQCGCGRKYWMPSGDFNEWRLNEQIYRMVTTTAKDLAKAGEYEKAIKVLEI